VGGDGGFVSYDNPETVRAKAAFAKQKGLGVSYHNTAKSMHVMSKAKSIMF
jgi:chitinase